MSDNTFSGLVIVALCLLLPFVAFRGKNIGHEEGKQLVRTEAVERGFAEWVPDKEGNTTFKWKEVAK